MRVVFLCLSLLLLCRLTLLCQSSDSTLDKLVDEMAEYKRLHYERLSVEGHSHLYKLFLKLRSLATENELLELTRHKSPVVKGYSVWALVDKASNHTKDLFLSLKTDTTYIDSRQGDLGGYDPLIFLLYDRAYMNHHRFRANNLEVDRLKAQVVVLELDSIILYNDGEPFKSLRVKGHDYLDYDFVIQRSLDNNHGNLARYDIIRKWAIEKQNVDAVTALASFQNSQDIEIIKRFGPEAFHAIALFPNNRFREYLAKVKAEDYNKGYFQALAAFKDSWAVNQFRVAYRELNEYNLNSHIIDIVFSLDPTIAEYEPLVVQIFEETGFILDTWLERFISNNSEDAAALISNAYSNAPVYILSLNDLFEFEDEKELYREFLTLLHEHQPESLEQACNRALTKNISLSLLEVYTEMIIKHHLTGVKEKILESLTQHVHPRATFMLTEAALSLKDDQYNQRVLKQLRQMKGLRVNYLRKGLKPILEKYGLKLD